jgi:DNA-binding HxlR family transcriptional regulator
MAPELVSHVRSFPEAGNATLPHDAVSESPLETALLVLGGHWRPLVLWGLFWRSKSFSELMRSTPGITQKSLRHELVELERYGLVRRETRPHTSRREEYSLTPFGETLRPLVAAMYEWGLYVQTDGRKLPLGDGQALV